MIPNTECTIPYIPVSVAKSNKLSILPEDIDEPEIQNYSGNDPKIVDQCKFFAHIEGFICPKTIRLLLLKEKHIICRF